MAVQRGLPDVNSLGGLKDGLAGDEVNAFLGSEATSNNAIQAGSIVIGTNAGSAWAIFGKPFTNPPMVVATIGSGVIDGAAGAGSAYVYVNDINTGSAEIICGIGSSAVGFTDGPVLNWIAFGTY
jgi:hypothetical protein